MKCPTLCDDDCETDCHEGHQPRKWRDHQPEDCPSRNYVEVHFPSGAIVEVRRKRLEGTP